MCQRAVRRLCNPCERCLVRKVARLLAQPLKRKSKPGVLSARDTTVDSLAHKVALMSPNPIMRRLEKMIPYMDLNEQVDADFTRARRRARLRAVMARIRREHTSNRLLSFDDLRREFAANYRLPRGTRVVEVEEILGSVGRWDAFDRYS